MKLALLAELNAERQARRAAVLATDTASGEARLIRAAELAGAPLNGSALGEAVADALRKGRSGTVEVDGKALFLTVYVPPVKVVITGAVHISQALAPMLRQVGFDLTIIDPRTAFATPERFPGERVLAEWPETVLPGLAIDAYTAFVALTHDPKIDDPGLEAALRAGCFYIGALGSRKTHAGRVARLMQRGFSEVEIGRIHAPVGLDIGAISPAEIAVSVLAEIIGTLRQPT
ncbi:MAG: XdhC family protein [Proteobacteria bacterium]|nr:XdhC family protein [Pseudomonadota bacterium]